MKREVQWTIASVAMLWASHAFAATAGGLFADILPMVTEFVNMLYGIGVVGIVVGAIWAMVKWYNTREMSEGFWGMFTVCISAIWLFFIVPKLVAFVPTFG